MTRLSQCAKVNTLAETTQETVKKKKKTTDRGTQP